MQRSTIVQIRVTPIEKELIDRAAGRSHLKTAEWARSVLLIQASEAEMPELPREVIERATRSAGQDPMVSWGKKEGELGPRAEAVQAESLDDSNPARVVPESGTRTLAEDAKGVVEKPSVAPKKVKPVADLVDVDMEKVGKPAKRAPLAPKWMQEKP